MQRIRHAARLAVDGETETFYPEAVRKSLVRRLGDHALHLVRFGEVDTSYYVFASDLVSNPRPIPYPEFRRIRDLRNAVPTQGGYTYVCLLRDKYLFGLLARSLGYATPRTIARLHRDHIDWTDHRGRRAFESLGDEDLDGFAKRLSGEGGKGAFSLRVRDGAVDIDGAPTDLEAVQRRLDRPFLLQERVAQHPALARLHPASLNTFRIMTVLEGGVARPFATILRIGVRNAVQDNASSGGVSVWVDRDTCRTQGRGFVRRADVGWIETHPDTDVALDGIEVPFVETCIEVACRFHEDLPQFYTLGWDLAMSPTEPVVIECNDNWGARILAPVMPDFWGQFRALYDLDA
ncbi:MAG: sugar-transfer associated ATP-grasp domain-containing protein [Bacteroidota bacterium]